MEKTTENKTLPVTDEQIGQSFAYLLRRGLLDVYNRDSIAEVFEERRKKYGLPTDTTEEDIKKHLQVLFLANYFEKYEDYQKALKSARHDFLKEETIAFLGNEKNQNSPDFVQKAKEILNRFTNSAERHRVIRDTFVIDSPRFVAAIKTHDKVFLDKLEQIVDPTDKNWLQAVKCATMIHFHGTKDKNGNVYDMKADIQQLLDNGLKLYEEIYNGPKSIDLWEQQTLRGNPRKCNLFAFTIFETMICEDKSVFEKKMDLLQLFADKKYSPTFDYLSSYNYGLLVKIIDLPEHMRHVCYANRGSTRPEEVSYGVENMLPIMKYLLENGKGRGIDPNFIPSREDGPVGGWYGYQDEYDYDPLVRLRQLEDWDIEYAKEKDSERLWTDIIYEARKLLLENGMSLERYAKRWKNNDSWNVKDDDSSPYGRYTPKKDLKLFVEYCEKQGIEVAWRNEVMDNTPVSQKEEVNIPVSQKVEGHTPEKKSSWKTKLLQGIKGFMKPFIDDNTNEYL